VEAVREEVEHAAAAGRKSEGGVVKDKVEELKAWLDRGRSRGSTEGATRTGGEGPWWGTSRRWSGAMVEAAMGRGGAWVGGGLGRRRLEPAARGHGEEQAGGGADGVEGSGGT
jgi:hypothetical protein